MPKWLKIDLDFFFFNFEKGKYTRSENTNRPRLYLSSTSLPKWFASAVPNEIAETAGELRIHSVHTPRYRNGALEYERLEKRCVGNEIVGEDREMGWNSSPPFLDV